MTSKINGVYAATIVPLNQDRSININELSDHLIDISKKKSLRGVLINGHAGENHILTKEEQINIVKISRDIVPKNFKIVSGLNFEDSDIASSVADKMINNGADSIMIFPPFSWSIAYDHHLIINHHKIISKNIDFPIMLYQASIASGNLPYNTETLKNLIDIKQVIAIKEGSWETSKYEENRKIVKSLRPEIAVMASGDEHLMSCFTVGTEGSLVSLAIIIPDIILNLYDAIKKKNFQKALKYHNKIYPLAKAIYGFPPSSHATARLKTCLKMLGKIKNDKMRSSINSLNKNDINNLKSALTLSGLQIKNHII